MSRKNKRLSVLLVAAAIMCSSVLNVFAASDISKDKVTIQKQELKKQELKKQLELTAKKYGGKYEVEGEADPNTTLKFDNVEEFEKFLESHKLQNDIPLPTVSSSDSTTPKTTVEASSLATTASTQKICTYDHNAFGLPVNLLVEIRQKVVVNMIPSSASGLLIFGSVVSKTSYLYGTYYADFSWTCDSQTTQILDGGRTLAGHINGHLTCKVSISGIGVGATYDQDFYHEWGYSSYQ